MMGPVTSDTAATGVVRLLGFPRQLFAAAEEQWEALLREYALRGLGGAQQAFDADEVNRARSALAEVADAAADGLDGDGTLRLRPTRPGDFALLQAVVHDARRLALRGELLTMPLLPELVGLRNWIAEQVPAQAAGAPPEPWDIDRYAVPHADPEALEPARWEPDLLPPPDTAWLVADDHNRIAAASPAALGLLGWGRDLVGQRLLVVIPPAFREAHVAGFLRSLVSGAGDLLGVPLDLPALRADGSQVPIQLLLSRHPAEGGRAVYLGRFTLRAGAA